MPLIVEPQPLICSIDGAYTLQIGFMILQDLIVVMLNQFVTVCG